MVLAESLKVVTYLIAKHVQRTRYYVKNVVIRPCQGCLANKTECFRLCLSFLTIVSAPKQLQLQIEQSKSLHAAAKDDTIDHEFEDFDDNSPDHPLDSMIMPMGEGLHKIVA